ATFTDNAYFGYATFTGVTSFQGTTFTGNAYFPDAAFDSRADFRDATFTGDADFSGVAFQRTADFAGDGTARGAAKGACPRGLLAAAKASEGTVLLPRWWTHPRRVRLKNPPPGTDTPAPPEQDEEP
ncbi:Pentapeptide repeat-containing protein, partial [Nocardiopsis flavescens]